jgi:hypothetical protein
VGHTPIERSSDHCPASLEDIDPTEVLPQSKRYRRQYDPRLPAPPKLRSVIPFRIEYKTHQYVNLLFLFTAPESEVSVPSSWGRGRGLPSSTTSFDFTLLLAMTAACVTPATTHLVSVEVIESLVSTFWKRIIVAVMRVKAVINIAVEVAGAVEPGAGSNEEATREPLGSIVPYGAQLYGA